MKHKPVIVLGAGGHAQVCLDILMHLQIQILGLTSTSPSDKSLFGHQIIGDDSVIASYDPHDIDLVNGIGFMPGHRVRRDKYLEFKKQGYHFVTLVHHLSIVSPLARLTEGCQIMAGAILQPGVQIGENTIINTRASIDHGCVLGKHVHVAPGVTMCGDVNVGDGVFIGTNSTIFQQSQINSDTTVPAVSTIKS